MQDNKLCNLAFGIFICYTLSVVKVTVSRKNAMFKKTSFIIVLVASLSFPSLSWASYSAHPMQLYVKAEKVLQSYRGDPATLAEAKKIFSTLITKFPTSALGYVGLSHVYVIEACRYTDHYDMQLMHDQALPYATKALELGPSLQLVHEQYAVIENIFNRYEEQQKNVQDRLLLKPDDPETYFFVANFMRDQGEIDKAVKYFNIALDMNPEPGLSLRILNRLGWLYLSELNQPERAVEYYQKSLDAGGASPLVTGFIGIAYYQMGRYQLSVKTLTESVTLLPNDFARYYLLQAQGKLLQQQGLSTQAIDALEEALQYGENSHLHRNLANMYLGMADFNRAYRHFQEVIASDPEEATAYYYAAKSLFSLGKSKQAVDYYSRYLQLTGTPSSQPDAHSTKIDTPMRSD